MIHKSNIIVSEDKIYRFDINKNSVQFYYINKNDKIKRSGDVSIKEANRAPSTEMQKQNHDICSHKKYNISIQMCNFTLLESFIINSEKNNMTQHTFD